MSRRIVGFIAALLLALVGTVALVGYVASAERRALAGEELVEVYVVGSPVPSGTAAEEIEPFLTVEQVPLKVRAEGAVDNLPALTGLVTAVDLVPGEQLVTSRFVERSAFADREVGIDVPVDMIEVTVELDPQRAVGGLLEPGQTVAVLASFEPFKLSQGVIELEDGQVVGLPAAAAEEIEGSTPNSTDLILRKVLVTAVQERERRSSGGEPSEDQRLTTAPGGAIYVTLAVTPFDVERLVFAAEFGTVWLAVDREAVPEGGASGQTRGSVLADPKLETR
jgi:pilus assembly protein CpaB